MKHAMVSTAYMRWAHVALGHCESSGTLFETEDKSVKEIEAETCKFLLFKFLRTRKQQKQAIYRELGR